MIHNFLRAKLYGTSSDKEIMHSPTRKQGALPVWAIPKKSIIRILMVPHSHGAPRAPSYPIERECELNDCSKKALFWKARKYNMAHLHGCKL